MDDSIALKWQRHGNGISVMEQSTYDPSMFHVNDGALEIKGDGNPYGPVAFRVPIPQLCPENEWTTITTRHNGRETELYADGVPYALST